MIQIALHMKRVNYIYCPLSPVELLGCPLAESVLTLNAAEIQFSHTASKIILVGSNEGTLYEFSEFRGFCLFCELFSADILGDVGGGQNLGTSRMKLIFEVFKD